MDNRAKKTFLCECVNSSFIASDTVNMEFRWPGSVPEAGQFFLIKPRRSQVFLARPISAALWRKAEPEVSKTYSDDVVIVRFIIAVRGAGSRELAELKSGDEAELMGPLGNSWASAAGKAMNTDNGKPLALVSGGVGIAPILALIQELGSGTFDLYAGFRAGTFGLNDVKPRTLVVATEDGSRGKKGRIPDFFKPDAYAAVFACGPEPMLKAIGARCAENGVPCFVSMEKHMACGVGACLGCRVKTSGGNRSCCSDGPVFNFKEILFDE